MRNSINPSYSVPNGTYLSGGPQSDGYENFTYYTARTGEYYAFDLFSDKVYQYSNLSDSWFYDPEMSDLYAGADSDARQIVAEQKTDNFESMIGDFIKALPAIAQAKLQFDLNKVNLTRAEKGLPPINAAAYAPGVNVGLSGDTQKLVMYGGIGLLALGFLSTMKKGR